MRLQHFALVGTFALISTLTLLTACNTTAVTQDSAHNNPDTEVWVDLFNGKDLNDWTIKFANQEPGVNYLNTFQVNDGLLQVRYDNYTGFDNNFGHIVYHGGPYSYYKLLVEYRFVGEQVKDGEAWAFRNNGIMYHSQSATEMGFTQWFPTSIEYQLLGGDGEHQRSTANLCTPDTQVVIDGELRKDHCIESSSDTFHGDQWVTAELLVHGSELAQHRVNGKQVMEYNDLQLDDGTLLSSGYIALQAESHPTDFRRVRLLNLEGCMDSKAKNFKSYLVKSKPDACVY